MYGHSIMDAEDEQFFIYIIKLYEALKLAQPP